jgi:hypothetical protein
MPAANPPGTWAASLRNDSRMSARVSMRGVKGPPAFADYRTAGRRDMIIAASRLVATSCANAEPISPKPSASPTPYANAGQGTRGRCRMTTTNASSRRLIAAAARQSRDRETRRIVAAASRRRGTGHAASAREAPCAWPFQAPPRGRLPSLSRSRARSGPGTISPENRNYHAKRSRNMRATARSAVPFLPRNRDRTTDTQAASG